MDIGCIFEGPMDLGEGPMWHVKEQALYWIDIANPSLHRLEFTSNQHQSWKMPAVIGAIAPHAHGGLIAAVGEEVVKIDLPSGEITPIVSVISGQSELRLNDGKCDRAGRFWVGAACFDRENPTGGLFRLDVEGSLTQMEGGMTISNGLGWSPDNKTFYYTNGLEYVIYAYDFDLAKGEISNRRVFAKLPEGPVEPDGLTIDSEGYVWAARWNAGMVVRYAPDGRIDRELYMPISRPTSCIFGGPNLETLFITSCSKSIGENLRLPSPAGAIFAIDVGVKGLPEPEFLG